MVCNKTVCVVAFVVIFHRKLRLTGLVNVLMIEIKPLKVPMQNTLLIRKNSTLKSRYMLPLVRERCLFSKRAIFRHRFFQVIDP